MPDPIAIDQGPPTEPGWYLVQRSNMPQPYLVGVEDQVVYTVASVLRLVDFQGARWSARLNIVEQPNA